MKSTAEPQTSQQWHPMAANHPRTSPSGSTAVSRSGVIRSTASEFSHAFALLILLSAFDRPTDPKVSVSGVAPVAILMATGAAQPPEVLAVTTFVAASCRCAAQVVRRRPTCATR